MKKMILTTMGEVEYRITGYYRKGNKKKEYFYLVDQILGYESGQKMSLGAAAQALEEAVESSYGKGDKRASITDKVSKQAVKDLVHQTVVEMPKPRKKKKLIYFSR